MFSLLFILPFKTRYTKTALWHRNINKPLQTGKIVTKEKRRDNF